MGRDEYPKMLTYAYDLVINWKGDSKGIGVTLNESVSFTTEADKVDVHHGRGEDDPNCQASNMPHLRQEPLRKQLPYQRGRDTRKKATKTEDANKGIS